MSIERICWTALAVLIACTTAACSSTAPAQTEASSPNAPDRDPSEQNAAEQDAAESRDDLEALYWARQDSARANFTEADVRFMRGMIGHHAQALVMSRLAPSNGASEQVQTLAARIINAQKDEIATMQQWLRRRDQPVPEIDIEGTTLRVNGHVAHGMPMPGMLTQAQIQELAEARGAEFDRLFLTYMIQHHQGAVTMVDTLFSTEGAAQDGSAFKLASDINADQTTEIARMRQMLERLPSADANSDR